ncbi:MAG: hypothetical protein PHU85_08680, partial [Phycisphaerae bacterium]|nr:hypothetical protein [Phycisphaerae bacterium]
GISLIALGGAIAAGALLMFDRASKCLAGLGILATFLASSLAGSVLIHGDGMTFYVVLGGLIAAAGSCHPCLSGVCKADGQGTTPPPESKL